MKFMKQLKLMYLQQKLALVLQLQQIGKVIRYMIELLVLQLLEKVLILNNAH